MRIMYERLVGLIWQAPGRPTGFDSRGHLAGPLLDAREAWRRDAAPGCLILSGELAALPLPACRFQGTRPRFLAPGPSRR